MDVYLLAAREETLLDDGRVRLGLERHEEDSTARRPSSIASRPCALCQSRCTASSRVTVLVHFEAFRKELHSVARRIRERADEVCGSLDAQVWLFINYSTARMWGAIKFQKYRITRLPPLPSPLLLSMLVGHQSAA